MSPIRAVLAVAAATTTVLASVAATPLEDIAWYTPKEDVTEHAKIDLDVEAIEMALEGEGGANFTLAKEIYTQGLNSAKGDGLRKLQAFSWDIAGKEALLNENRDTDKLLQEFVIAKNYFDGDERYADKFVMDAFDGVGNFEGLGVIPRIELAVKGIQYQVVWMYILRELYESLKSCLAGEVQYKNWDEGVAFYAGSKVGPKPTAETGGFLLYALAEKRCKSFGTCTGDISVEPGSAANKLAINAFSVAQGFITSKECEKVSEGLLLVRKHMQIPLIQGALLYAFRGDKNVYSTTDKETAEGWAFAAPLLPFINETNPDEAAMIRSNMEMKAGKNGTMTDGYEEVFKAFYKVLPSLCISCEELGVNNFEVGDGNNLPVCTTDTEALEAGCAEYLRPIQLTTDIGILIGLLAGSAVLLVLVGVGMWWMWRSPQESKTNELGQPLGEQV